MVIANICLGSVVSKKLMQSKRVRKLRLRDCWGDTHKVSNSNKHPKKTRKNLESCCYE